MKRHYALGEQWRTNKEMASRCIYELRGARDVMLNRALIGTIMVTFVLSNIHLFGKMATTPAEQNLKDN